MSRNQFLPVKNKEYRFMSGKYKGEKLGDILIRNPAYIIYLHEKNYLTIQLSIIDEAREALKLRNGQKGNKK